MKKNEKAMNLEAARILMIEWRELFDKGIGKLEDVIGAIPKAQAKHYTKAMDCINTLLCQVILQQNKLGE